MYHNDYNSAYDPPPAMAYNPPPQQCVNNNLNRYHQHQQMNCDYFGVQTPDCSPNGSPDNDMTAAKFPKKEMGMGFDQYGGQDKGMVNQGVIRGLPTPDMSPPQAEQDLGQRLQMQRREMGQTRGSHNTLIQLISQFGGTSNYLKDIRPPYRLPMRLATSTLQALSAASGNPIYTFSESGSQMPQGFDGQRRDFYNNHSSSSMSPPMNNNNSPSASMSDRNSPFPTTSHLYSALSRSPTYRHLNNYPTDPQVFNPQQGQQIKIEMEDPNSQPEQQQQFQFMSSYGSVPSYNNSTNFGHCEFSSQQQDAYSKTSDQFPFGGKTAQMSSFNPPPDSSAFVSDIFGDIDGKELDRYLAGSASAYQSSTPESANLSSPISLRTRQQPGQDTNRLGGQFQDFSSKPMYGNTLADGLNNKLGHGCEEGDTMSEAFAALRSIIS